MAPGARDPDPPPGRSRALAESLLPLWGQTEPSKPASVLVVPEAYEVVVQPAPLAILLAPSVGEPRVAAREKCARCRDGARAPRRTNPGRPPKGGSATL